MTLVLAPAWPDTSLWVFALALVETVGGLVELPVLTVALPPTVVAFPPFPPVTLA